MQPQSGHLNWGEELGVPSLHKGVSLDSLTKVNLPL